MRHVGHTMLMKHSSSKLIIWKCAVISKNTFLPQLARYPRLVRALTLTLKDACAVDRQSSVKVSTWNHVIQSLLLTLSKADNLN